MSLRYPRRASRLSQLRALAFPLAFIALLIAPGATSNPMYYRLTIVVIILLIWSPFDHVKLDPPGKTFLVWVAWAGVCTYFSEYPAMALQGFYMRSEGLLTLLVISCLALSYWNFHKSVKVLAFVGSGVSLMLVYFYIVQFDYVTPEVFRWNFMPEIAWSSLAGLSAIAIYSIHPLLVLLVAPAFYYCDNRSGLIGAVLGILCYSAFKWPTVKRKWPFYTLFGIGVLVFANSPLAYKFKMVDFNTLGSGSRAQWILQADRLDHMLPLTGYGLDTLSNYLEPASGPTAQVGAIADKTHNFMYDAILQTGWIGYTVLLCTIGACIHSVAYNRTPQNLVCFSMLTGYLGMSMINPPGIIAHTMALVALFGIRKP